MVNPWGADFNEFGDLFTTNTVIAHLWHIVPGMYCQRRDNERDNPYVYRRIQSITNHLHWGGGQWQSSRESHGRHSVAGGFRSVHAKRAVEPSMYACFRPSCGCQPPTVIESRTTNERSWSFELPTIGHTNRDLQPGRPAGARGASVACSQVVMAPWRCPHAVRRVSSG